MRQILDVLLGNALTHGSGKVTITGTRVGGGAVVAIADEGQAIIDPDEIFRRRSGNAAHPSDHPQRQPPLTRSSETTNSSAE